MSPCPYCDGEGENLVMSRCMECDGIGIFEIDCEQGEEQSG